MHFYLLTAGLFKTQCLNEKEGGNNLSPRATSRGGEWSFKSMGLANVSLSFLGLVVLIFSQSCFGVSSSCKLG